jgi:hypothetical protein
MRDITSANVLRNRSVRDAGFGIVSVDEGGRSVSDVAFFKGA